jgi:hypothetical protein
MKQLRTIQSRKPISAWQAFLSGAASIFDISGTGFSRIKQPRLNLATLEADVDALVEYWLTMGGDFGQVRPRVRKDTGRLRK